MSSGIFQPVEFEFECLLPNGLHARPASHLAEAAGRFASDCSLVNLRTGARADLKSVLSTIAADVRGGDVCGVRIEGADSETAGSALRRFLGKDLPTHDEPLAEAAAGGPVKLPRTLAAAGVTCLAGLPVAGGIGQGGIVLLKTRELVAPVEVAADSRVEQGRVEEALRSVRARIQAMLDGGSVAEEAGILKAHMAILGDTTLRHELAAAIDRGRSAAQAVVDACGHFTAKLRASENSYIRERAIDVQELGSELLQQLCGAEWQPAALALHAPSIVVAGTLAPHQLLGLDRALLQGIVVESAGATSHAMILARSLGIPAVSGVAEASRALEAGAQAIVDGDRGLVFPAISGAVKRFYERERAAQVRRTARLARYGQGPATSTDGVTLEIAANVASAEELAPAIAHGADGVGVFRTEILFARYAAAPSEDEQFAIYSAAVRAAAGRPVIFRALDVGGDKPLPYLKLPAERNPFLGYRGIRIYEEHRDLLAAQIRAVLRASAVGPAWLMAPMIASWEEARWFQSFVASAREELRARGASLDTARGASVDGARDTPFDAAMPVGAMIEVPSAAFLMGPLASELDFFSIGSNDLSQYFFAADRENSKVASVSNVRSPAFLKLLQQIATEARTHQKWIGLCGEMAADPRNLPLLLGMGLNEISVSAHAIPALKQRTAGLSAQACRELLGQAIECSTGAEVEALLDAATTLEMPRPLLDRDLVLLRSDSRDKAEAIRELVNALHAAGRIESPDRMEETVWAREAVYATGVGHGFAIPHCKSDAVGSSCIAILELQNPIEWGSLDGGPVRMVILLAIRESGQNGLHMKVISRLARKLMDDDFRRQLTTIDDADQMVAHLARELEGYL